MQQEQSQARSNPGPKPNVHQHLDTVPELIDVILHPLEVSTAGQ